MVDTRGCVNNLSHHGRYGKARTTMCLVLQCLYDAEILSTCSYLCPCLLCACARMLNHLSTTSLERKSLMQDATLVEVGTHNNKSVSCRPIFWLEDWLDAHVTCLNMCNQSGRMIVVPPLLWADSIIHKTTK